MTQIEVTKRNCILLIHELTKLLQILVGWVGMIDPRSGVALG